MSDVNDMFGFELLQKLYDNELRKKEDVIILFIHWYLTKSGLKCIDTADGVDFNPSEKGSELLPEKWNLSPNYTLRYIKDGKVYVLIGVKSDADLLVNFLRHSNHAISNANFPIEQTVSVIHGTLETVIPTYQTVLHLIKKDLVNPIYSGNTNEATTQTTTSNDNTLSRYLVAPHRSTWSTSPNISLRESFRQGPVGVGARDLDPFAHPHGGGMIFDPFVARVDPRRGGLGIPGRLPPGAVPPGARFDPFGPPDIDMRPRPRGRLDDDHLPIPGYDDMFQ